MTIKNSKSVRLVGRILAIMMAVCLVFSMAITASAAAATGVDGAKNGVLKFNWLYDGDAYSRGSCFLINDTHVVTAYHCTMFSKAELDFYGFSGKTTQELKSRMTYSVTVQRDMTIGATLVTASEDMDFAIFKLDQSIPTRQYLKLRNSADVKAAETVYSVGFPANSDIGKSVNTYTVDDVTYKTGVVSKAQSNYEYMTTDGFHFNGNALQTSCAITGGDSGGPLVDENGAVVGVSVASNDNYYYAVAIDQVISACDDYGIDYTLVGVNPELKPYEKLQNKISAANGYKADDYTEDSFADLEKALTDAKAITESDDEEKINAAITAIDTATAGLEKKAAEPVVKEEEKDYTLIIVIGVAAVLIIGVVVVLIIVLSKKKAPAAAPAPAQAHAPVQPQPPVRPSVPVQAQPPVRPAVPVQPQAPVRPVAPAPAPAPARPAAPVTAETTVLNQGAGETTVLSQGAGETTVLSQAVNGGSLVRTSNNERIPIASAEFTVGRERSKVDYCVGDNSNISRIHARFVVRDGKTYIVDNKAANGTFVNGVKARAGQEIELNNGDKIVLADEKFEFNK